MRCSNSHKTGLSQFTVEIHSPVKSLRPPEKWQKKTIRSTWLNPNKVANRASTCKKKWEQDKKILEHAIY